jgi:hypothetical protein
MQLDGREAGTGHDALFYGAVPRGADRSSIGRESLSSIGRRSGSFVDGTGFGSSVGFGNLPSCSWDWSCSWNRTGRLLIDEKLAPS